MTSSWSGVSSPARNLRVLALMISGGGRRFPSDPLPRTELSTANTTLAVSITGIVVSGVVGPQLTGWHTRRAGRNQFERDQLAHRRDELRAVFDDAAVLLASGATNLRLIREAKQRQAEAPPELAEWIAEVFPMGQRLRLRLAGDDAVVVAYDAVRTALMHCADAPLDDEAATLAFEARRDDFLTAARDTLNASLLKKAKRS